MASLPVHTSAKGLNPKRPSSVGRPMESAACDDRTELERTGSSWSVWQHCKLDTQQLHQVLCLSDSACRVLLVHCR